MWLLKQIRQDPVLFQGLIQALFPVLVTFGVLQLQDSQLGVLYAFTAALLSFLTRTQVTPLSNPRDDAGNRLVPRPSIDS
ncbi:MAG: hypothetical protein HC849_02560 [Oscillatoriales cyanobacterium RU_3_3]|nr:hypothetical protein [Oscillatoriales cyanobacterium RU_3_3]